MHMCFSVNQKFILHRSIFAESKPVDTLMRVHT